MKIHALELYNFMLYRKFKKVFGDKDIIGILAEYLDDPIRSNKGGKSTIVEAIKYILQGSSRAEREIELIHHGESEMWGKLVLEEDGKFYSIKRGRDIKNNGLLEVEGVDKKREAQEVIDELIGYNKSELDLTCFFKQMDINQFMELKPADKKHYLMTWLKRTHWPKLERAVLDDLADINRDVEKHKARIETFKDEKIDTKNVKTHISILKKEIETKSKKLSIVEKKILRLSSASKEIRSIKEQLQDLLERESVIKKKIKLRDSIKEEIADLGTQITMLPKVKSDPLEDERKLLKELHVAEERASALSDELSVHKRHMTGVCPILMQACDRIKPDVSALDKIRQQRKELQERAAQITGEIKKLKQQKIAQDRRTELESDLRRAKGRISDFSGLDEELATISHRSSELSGRLSRLESSLALDALAEIETRRDSLRRAIEQANETLGSQRELLKRNAALTSKIQLTVQELDNLKRKAADLRYVAFMFGKNGIPSQEIENAFDEIEDEANYVLERLGTHLQLEFRPDRELQTWEELCIQCGWKFPRGARSKSCAECGAHREHKRKDELQLRVLENGVDEGFHMESGGGKSLVSIAVRIALTRLKQRQSNSRFNVLFLDEPDSAFDSANKKAFTRLITNTLVKDFGFEQIFWVSHDKEIQEAIPNVLKVTRYKTFSKAAWG